MDTVELKVILSPVDPWREIAIAQLADLGFDSFVEDETGFLAYAPATVDVEDAIQQSILVDDDVQVEWSKTVIPYQNWNASWEANFNPVEVENYATILAPFHDESDAKGLKVVIQPQMSFGTGHHQTTWMMTKALFELNPLPKKILDMGTGTGVLAIVAEKLGADDILAVDIEDWSVENAIENCERNKCVHIRCKHGDIDVVDGEEYGLILANINKNILKSHLAEYSRLLKEGGVLMLSGFFISDVEELEKVAEENGLKLARTLTKDEWAAMELIKL